MTPLKKAFDDCTGTAWTMKSHPDSASAGSVVARTDGGSSYCGRYFAFRCVSLMDLASASDSTRMTTSRSRLFRARSVPIAVPNEPPPMMATFFVLARTSSFVDRYARLRVAHRTILSQLSFTLRRSSSEMPFMKRSYVSFAACFGASDDAADRATSARPRRRRCGPSSRNRGRGSRRADDGDDFDAAPRAVAARGAATRASFVSFLDAHREDAHAVNGPAAHRET